MAAAPIAGVAGGLIGGLFGQNQQDWLKNTLVQLLNNSQGANQFGLTRALEAQDPLSFAAQNLMNLGNQFSFGAPGSDSGGAFTRYNDDLNSLFQGLNPSQFQGNGLSGLSQQTLGNLSNVAGQVNNSPWNQVIGQGGVTGQGGALSDRLMDLVNGFGRLDSLGDVGTSVVGQRGQTDR